VEDWQEDNAERSRAWEDREPLLAPKAAELTVDGTVQADLLALEGPSFLSSSLVAARHT
jgi:hypothetical protein